MSSRYEQIVKEMEVEFPGFKVIVKDKSWLMWAVYYVSFMFIWNKVFMTYYTTVMFGKVYTQQEHIGTDSMYRTLRHERIHLRDAKKYPLLFELSYLILLPAVFSMRAFWEYRAFKESVKALAEDQQNIFYGWQLNNILDKFCNSHYLWMFPFRQFLKNKFIAFMKEQKITFEE